MPNSPFECPSCGSVMMTTGFPAGSSIRCPVCRAVVKVPADDDVGRDEIDEADDEPRKRRSKPRRNARGRSKNGGPPLGLWLGIGGAVVAVLVVLIIVLSGKRSADPAPEAKEGGGSDAYTVAKRIDTNIPLPKREPFVMIRGILGLAPSADASVIGVTSALSPRRYTINRATGKVIAEFDEVDAQDKREAVVGRTVYMGQPIVSPDGKLMIVPFSHEILVRTIKVRDVATGNVVKTLGDAKMYHFHKLAFSPKGDILYAIAHVPGEIVLVGWSVANWQEVCRIKMPENREPAWVFPLADGETVVTVTLRPKPQIDFFDVSKQTFVRSIVLTHKEIGVPAVSPDGKLLAVVANNGDFNRALDVFDLDTAKLVCNVLASRDITQPGGPPVDSFPQVEDVRFLPGGRLGVVAGHIVTGRFVATYDPKTGAQKAIWKHDGKIGGREITHLSFCASGEMLLVLDGDTATFLVVRLKE